MEEEKNLNAAAAAAETETKNEELEPVISPFFLSGERFDFWDDLV